MVARRGMSMIEVIVAGTMTLSLLILTYTILSQGIHYARETEANASAQQESHKAMRQIVRELTNSVKEHSDPGGSYITFLSAEPLTGQGTGPSFDPSTGRLVWKKWVCFWHDASAKTLVRAEIALTPAISDLTSVPSPVVPLNTPFLALPASEKRIVARGVEKFEAANAGQRSFKLELQVRTTASIATRQEATKQNQVNLASRVTVVNVFE